ncbi:MAG: 23S rRNA (adenine(1618)-N(6))-methyltransferase RlmF [Patiriisocius sp.]|jgi:23S rRNA (adenine1618-N6)-methyltransferase|tara:strand:+ start:218 stop:1126 length:909 start_codon:yes stop_codon:yes gene_type:complete
MHLQNPHRNPYNFELLIQANEELEAFVFTNEHEIQTIDFANPKGVFQLNKALLLQHYKLDHYQLPIGHLCPAVPGRADYLCHVKTLLDEHSPESNDNTSYRVLDIGAGANCIYPIIGAQLFNWQMVGADIHSDAVASAKEIVAATKGLKNNIEIRHQKDNANIFTGIIKEDEYFDVTICNPPFHTSEIEANKGTMRKLANISKDKDYAFRQELVQNFGGKANELWCNGGEALFIKRMIKQSLKHKHQVGVFTTLVSNKEHLNKLYKQLDKAKASHKTVVMHIGNKNSRMLAWSFEDQNLTEV